MEVWNRSESVGAFERIGVMSRESNVEALENVGAPEGARRRERIC